MGNHMRLEFFLLGCHKDCVCALFGPKNVCLSVFQLNIRACECTTIRARHRLLS